MAKKRRKASSGRRSSVSGARPVPAQSAAPTAPGFRWRTWLVRSLIVGVVVTVVTVGTSPPKNTSAGSLIPAIIEAVVIYGLIFFILAALWEVVLRVRRGGA